MGEVIGKCDNFSGDSFRTRKEVEGSSSSASLLPFGRSSATEVVVLARILGLPKGCCFFLPAIVTVGDGLKRVAWFSL